MRGRGFGKRPRRRAARVSEDDVQIAVVDALRVAGELVIHVPNGGKRSRSEGARLKRLGVLAGVPDLLVFSVPAGLEARGVALEVKSPGGRPSKAQLRVLDELRALGWAATWAAGEAACLEWLRDLGYAV